MTETSESVVFLDSTALISMSVNMSRGTVSIDALQGLTGPQNPTTIVTTTVLRELAPGRNNNNEVVTRVLGDYLNGQENLYVLETPQLPRHLGGDRGAGEASIIYTLSGLPVRVLGADNMIFGRQIPQTLGYNNVIIVSDNTGDFPEISNARVLSLREYLEYLDEAGRLPDSLRSELLEGDFDPTFCFKSDTLIQMWPLDPSIKPRIDGTYDEKLVLSEVWEKPICEIRVGDLVVSYDDKGRIKPGPVTRTMTNTATHLLDFWNTGVTPGHAYYCADGKFKDQHVPLMDILRTDGAIMRADGTMIRAATNCKVGSMGDMMINASATVQKPDGTWTEPKPGKVRFGTRIILPDGTHISFMEMAAREGWKVTDDGYMVGPMKGEDGTVEERAFHFPYSHGEELPKPEDYILARSKVSLEAIYAAGEWEQIGTRMPAPAGMVGLNTNHTSTLLQPSKPEPNIPPAFADHPDAPRSPQGRPLNRKQRKAIAAKERKAAKSRRRLVS